MPALCPNPGGHLIKRADCGRDFRMDALVELSFILVPKNSSLDGSRAGATSQLVDTLGREPRWLVGPGQ